MIDLEACVESYAEAKTAGNHGLKRIELCAGLDVGGLTPSLGLVEKCVALPEIETHVLIRPRAGDFHYNADELEIMERDIELVAKCGAKGVVFGVLDEDRSLNVGVNESMLTFSRSLDLEVTFHRAFDVCQNPRETLSKLIELGFDRLLTSGQAATAIEGIELICDLVDQAEGKIQVMAGCGVNVENAKDFTDAGVDVLHFSIRKPVRQERLGMGTSFEPDLEKLVGISAVTSKRSEKSPGSSTA